MTIAIKPTASGSTIEQDGSTVLSVESDRSVDIDSGTLHVDATNHNVGIGTTPPAWRSLQTVLSIGNNASVSQYDSGGLSIATTIASNLYIDSTNTSRYIQNLGVTTYSQRPDIGEHIWSNAPSGLAGNPVTSTVRMKIDSSGYVTMPSQPAFLATRGSGNLSTTGSGAKIPFDYTLFNTGNHFSTSTNAFTCPVDGVYMFTWQGYQNGTQTLRLDLYENGSRLVGGYVANTAGDGFSSSVIVKASTNDVFDVRMETLTTTLFYGGGQPHTYFSGILIG